MILFRQQQLTADDTLETITADKKADVPFQIKIADKTADDPENLKRLTPLMSIVSNH